jgi:hypothetical protein
MAAKGPKMLNNTSVILNKSGNKAPSLNSSAMNANSNMKKYSSNKRAQAYKVPEANNLAQ